MFGFFNRWWGRTRLFFHEHSFQLTLALIGFLMVVVYLSKNIFIFIEAGSAGVLYKRLGGGTQVSKVYLEGLHIIAPWNYMTIYGVRIQRIEHQFSVLSSNGLSVGVTVSIRFRPKTEFLGFLHKEIGPDYAEKIIIPEVQALIRNVFGQYTPEELYTSRRSVAQQIVEGSLDEIGERYVLLDDLLVQKITLPPAIQSAIESKLTEEQRVFEWKFRLDRERQEAERKIIEAKAVQEAHEIMSTSMTEPILRYRGIEATRDLAESPNAKLVIIGGKDGLPLIYDPSQMTESPVRRTNSAPGSMRVPAGPRR